MNPGVNDEEVTGDVRGIWGDPDLGIWLGEEGRGWDKMGGLAGGKRGETMPPRFGEAGKDKK